MYVIGTAGHIDHGKSTLIHALTAMHPDRLQAEQERGMTIDLGFAWLTLPSGTEIGIVDVPGHHRFIENMLAGVGGIRLTLFVIAADDGWMPQTQEHLEILDLLGVERGIVVLTKRDLVEDDWLDLVREDVAERLQGTVLEGAPVVAVAANTGQGMEELVATIDNMLANMPPAADLGRPRLWVDRVFSIRGAGTVVTGTLEGGSLRLEQAVDIEPGGKRARVRGLQTHARSVEQALPGTRVAVNLGGVETDAAARGDAVCAGPRSAATSYVNVDLRLLADAPHELEDLTHLQLYVGSAALSCRLRLLDREVARPGERVVAQLWLERAAPLRFGDRFVLRDKTYQRTVGGGRILDEDAERVRRPSLRVVGARRPWRLPADAEPQSGSDHGDRRVLDLNLLRERRAVAEAGPEAYHRLVEILVRERGVVSRDELVALIPLPAETVADAVAALAASGSTVSDSTSDSAPDAASAPAVSDSTSGAAPGSTASDSISDSAPGAAAAPATSDPIPDGPSRPTASSAIVALPSFIVDRSAWDRFADALARRVAEYHRRYPLRPGIGRETVRSGLDVPARLFEECIPVLVEEGRIAASGAHLRLPDYKLTFTPEQEKDVQRLLALLQEEPFSPPLWSDLLQRHGFDTEFLTALIGRGDVVRIHDDLLFPATVIADIEARVREHIGSHGSIDVAALRDMLQTSRKYALPILEYFDRIDVTRRVGDVRILTG